MSKQRTFFTEEQMAALRQNPYVYSVTQGTLALTKEFKEIFYAEYQNGILPRNILEQHGFDLNVLGTRRIWGISQHIRNEYAKYGEFHEGYHTRRSAGANTEHSSQPPTEQEQLKSLQAKVDYLEQQMEFLKKNFLDQEYQKVGALLMNDSSCAFEIIHQTLQLSGNSISISHLCEMAGVSRSGYYAWLKAAPIREEQERQDQEDFDIILTAYKHRGYKKGARSIYMRLLHQNPPVIMNIKKIRRLMEKFHLICPIRRANPYRQMAQALKTSNVADNLLQRQFEAYGPRLVLLTDITYLPYNGTFAYLSTILDAYTKQILSYVLSDSLEVDFVLETVQQLIAKHGISLHAETIVHSDQGCHYTSHKFINILYDKKLRQSMSRRGNCWDNAPQESFFGHMKDYIKPKLKASATFSEVSAIIDDYMDYYNNERYQWHLAKLSPNEFYTFVTTGVYPLDVASAPEPPSIEKTPAELAPAAPKPAATPSN